MPIYSNSRLSCYETCPLQYKFAYIDGIKREEEAIETFLGSRFHETMEYLYKDLKCKVHTLKELTNYFDSQWDKEWSDEIAITKRDRTKEDYKNLGKRFVEDYYKRYHPFDQGRVLGLEKEVFVDLKGDGKYKLRGYIDRLIQLEDGTYEIHDYKTSGSIPSQKELDEDRQLALYQVAIENTWNDVKQTRLVWHYVAFDKEMSSTRTKGQLEQLKKDTVNLIDKIESTKEFLPVESGLCNWCVYPDLCPKKKHLYKVDHLPVNEYLKDDGVKLTNTFARLVTDKKKHQQEIEAIDTELDKLKEAVIKYAKKEGVEVIKGSDNKLKIIEKQKISSPSKGSPERKELENVLRDINKWDEVSDLDSYAIERAINEARWDKKVVDKIKKFLTIETKTSVSLSKLQDKEK